VTLLAMFRPDAPILTESTVLLKQRNAAGQVVGVCIWPGVWAAVGAVEASAAAASASALAVRCKGLTSVLNGEWVPTRRGLGGPGWALRTDGAAGGADKGRRGPHAGSAARGTVTHAAVAASAFASALASALAPTEAQVPGPVPASASAPAATPRSTLVTDTVVATLADAGLEVLAAEVFVASPDRSVFTFVDFVCGALGGPRPLPPGSPVVLVELKTEGGGGGSGGSKHRFAQPLHVLPGNAMGAATAQLAATTYMFNECRPGGWVPVAAYLLHVAKVATPKPAVPSSTGKPTRQPRATNITLTPAGEPWWPTATDAAAWATFLDVGWCLVEARPSAWMTLVKGSPGWLDAKAALAAGAVATAKAVTSGHRSKPKHATTVVVPARIPAPVQTRKPKPASVPRGTKRNKTIPGAGAGAAAEAEPENVSTPRARSKIRPPATKRTKTCPTVTAN
jgi:hypothetical protein